MSKLEAECWRVLRAAGVRRRPRRPGAEETVFSATGAAWRDKAVQRALRRLFGESPRLRFEVGDLIRVTIADEAGEVFGLAAEPSVGLAYYSVLSDRWMAPKDWQREVLFAIAHLAGEACVAADCDYQRALQAAYEAAQLHGWCRGVG